MKKIAAFLCAAVVLFSLTLTAFAAPDTPADERQDQIPHADGQIEDHTDGMSGYAQGSTDAPTAATESVAEKQAQTDVATQAVTEPPKQVNTEAKDVVGGAKAPVKAEDDAVNRTAIIVVVICGAVLLVLLIVIIALLLRKKQPTEKSGSSHGLSVHGLPVKVEVLSGVCYNAGTEFRLRRNLTIGTDQGCDLVFDDPQMLPMHAVISAQSGIVVLEECDETGVTYIGGMKIFAPNRLRSGDIVTIGSTSFRIFFE